MKAIVKQVTERVLGALGLRMVNDQAYLNLTEKAAAFLELTERARAFEARSIELEGAIGRLREQKEEIEAAGTRLREEAAGLRDSLRWAEAAGKFQRARTQWTKAMFEEMLARQRREFGDLIRSMVKQSDPGNSRRRMLILVTSSSQVTQLKALASSEQLRSGYEVTVVAYAGVKESGILELCERSGLRLLTYDLQQLCGDFLNITAEPDSLHPSTDIEAELREREPTEDVSRMHDIVLFFNELREQSRIAATAQRALKATSADLLVLFEDNAEYATGIWISAANRMSIPSVIVPYTIADQREPAEAYVHNENYGTDGGIYNRLAEIAFPHWLYHHRGRWLLRRPGVRLIAAEALGVAPPAPWILNSSRASAIAVESAAMHEHYVAHDIPAAQLVTTGSVTDDMLHHALEQKDELRRGLGLVPGKPVLLCSLPPNQLNVPRPECPFPGFRSIVDFWLNELKRVGGWEIVVKLHPSMRLEDIDYVRTLDVRISDWETTSLIPLCDLYNASVSSTIRWALACGKPVLNYDVYRYCYQDFVSEPAVLTVSDGDAFSNALRRLTQDKESLRDLAGKAAAAASRWGMNDGRSMERILALFRRLTDPRSVAASAS